MNQKSAHRQPTRFTKGYFRISLCLISMIALTLLYSYLQARAIDPVYANHYYPQLMEYILASLAIAFGFSYLLELHQADLEKRQ